MCPIVADKTEAEVCGKTTKDGADCNGSNNNNNNNTVTVRLDSIAKELGAVVGQSSDGISTSVELAPRVVVECAVVTSARIVDSNFDVFSNCTEREKK